MFKNLISNISNKLEQQKAETNQYNSLIDKTTSFKNLFPIQETNQEISLFKITSIQNNCPDINKEKALLINKLIPKEETYLNTFYSKEILTNKEFYIIPTNKYLWLINQSEYGAFNYQNLTCQIIKNNLMSKVILLNNVLLEVNGTNNIQNLIDIITNTEIRNKIITEKTSYLCGIIPNIQMINSIGSGLSIDNNNNIVFHKKDDNLKTTINELTNYEVLIDNQAIYSKNSSSSNKMTSFSTGCYNISIKITTSNNNTFIIPILEQNSLGTKYNTHDTLYQENLTFAKSIIDKLKEIQKIN